MTRNDRCVTKRGLSCMGLQKGAHSKIGGYWKKKHFGVFLLTIHNFYRSLTGNLIDWSTYVYL